MAQLRELTTLFLTGELHHNPETKDFSNGYSRTQYVEELYRREDGKVWLAANHLSPVPAVVEVPVDDGFVEPPQIFQSEIPEEFDESETPTSIISVTPELQAKREETSKRLWDCMRSRLTIKPKG